MFTLNSPKVPVHDEYQYLNLIRDILEIGEVRPDRHEYTRFPLLMFTEHVSEQEQVQYLSLPLRLCAFHFPAQHRTNQIARSPFCPS